MKKLLITLSILICAASYSQVRDTTLKLNNTTINAEYDLSWGKQKIEQHLKDVKGFFQEGSQKSSTSIKTILNKIPLSKDGCENGSFESGYIGWTGLSLRHDLTILPIENGLNLYPGIVPLPMTSTLSGGNYTNIESPGVDQTLSVASPPFSMQKVKDGSKSISLGNNQPGYGAEGIAKRFVVTAANAKYYFQYAIVMDKSHSNFNGSSNGSEAFFIAEAVDMVGNTIDKVVEIGNPNNPFIKSTSNESIYFRDWRCSYLDLSSKIGQEVVVMFINSDCSKSGHNGYTYVDAVCRTCVNTSEGHIAIRLSPDSCAVFPSSISGSFAMPTSGLAQNQNITLQIFDNNNLVGTLTNPNLVGTNFSFTINASDFPNQKNGKCYDLVAVLKFNYPNMNGQMQPVTLLSSNVSGNPAVQNGARWGVNNDICFCSPPPPPPTPTSELCCNIANLTARLTENNGVFGLSINSGGVPIQEVEISMVDFHAVYSEQDCKPVNMGVNIGNITTTTTSLNSLALVANQNNSQVLTWLSGTPTVVNNQISFTVQKPAVLNLSCCSVQLWFCIKLKVKDINCNICEKLLCFPVIPVASCDCKGAGWVKDQPVLISDAAGQVVGRASCSGTASVSLKAKYVYQFKAPDFSCNPASCKTTYKWKIIQGTAIVGSGEGQQFSYTFRTPGTYVVEITPNCGSQACDPCKFTVRAL